MGEPISVTRDAMAHLIEELRAPRYVVVGIRRNVAPITSGPMPRLANARQDMLALLDSVRTLPDLTDVLILDAAGAVIDSAKREGA